MVSRVDRKPVIYGAGFVRFIRPCLESHNKKVLNTILSKSMGHGMQDIKAHDLMNAFEDIDDEAYWAGMNINYSDWSAGWVEEEEEEVIRVARACFVNYTSNRTAARAQGMAEAMVKCSELLMQDIDEVYYGPEASYILMNYIINEKVFDTSVRSANWEWATNTAASVMNVQGPYCYLHASATGCIGKLGSECITNAQKFGWDVFKKTETLVMRLGSRKSVLAHAYHMGTLRKPFEESDPIVDDFELPLTGYVKSQEGIRVWVLNGLRIVKIGQALLVLTHDDCVSVSLLAQCFFRNAMYFTAWNGYGVGGALKAIGVAKDFYGHIVRLIRAGKNFANFIRSVHICAQKEFNDIYEKERGDDLGWEARSENYTREALELDSNGPRMYEKCVSLACSKIDRLNVGLMYHMFVGDDMMASDLVSKVAAMPTKVLDADKEEWSKFTMFAKSYLLSRYLFNFKRKPQVGGDLEQMNKQWVSRCIRGKFTMPKVEDYGKVWIEGEFPWSNHADTWHLDAQDVAYVMKDLKGMRDGAYRKDRKCASELLMAMEHGEILDPLAGTKAHIARERILSGAATHVVVLTTAPKAENAKPSWKKRVTFAADNEFRKMQAEYDRNARKCMTFIRGPSLGMDQSILETQFRDIAQKTGATTMGCICSHDISAWSESMDRDRKFDFEQILINMTTKKDMVNIKHDWDKIHAVVNKLGVKKEFALNQGSFQGFDGSASTILHSIILLYCIETARRASIISTDVKTNLATLIDDCVALMEKLTDKKEANNFWAHLKTTYRKLGFEVDELKSIFSTIKAIYLSRRFLLGGEVPADYKIYIKAHVSYEDPLRSITDVPKDIFGALRGACDANGQAWFIYYSAVCTSLVEMSHQCPAIMELPPGAAAICAIAPPDEMGWGFPSIVDWATNDIVDKRTHFNAIMELAAEFDCAPEEYKAGFNALTPSGMRMFNAIKSQPWRQVNYSGLFTNPYEAIRDGPMKPDLLKRSAVADILKDIVKAEPWKSLLEWNTSETTTLVRELLVRSGPLSAPILGALVNCMPDNYRLGMVGKAVGSSSVLDMLPRGIKISLKRRVHNVGSSYVTHALGIYLADKTQTTAEDISVLSYLSRTLIEREEFYALNGIKMIDHTFPDPVAVFTRVTNSVGSKIRPCGENLRQWDPTVKNNQKVSERLSNKGTYVPGKSARVWEVATEYGKGWDTVSQKIALGMAVLARAQADGHNIEGLMAYFIRSWNEASNITIADMGLIAIQGSIKRLDANPGSSTHPICVHRNLCTGFIVDITTSINALDVVSKELTGTTSHLHDIHSCYTAMRCVTSLIYELMCDLVVPIGNLEYLIGLRRDSVVAASTEKMTTGLAANRILLEIMDSETPYGLVQACPDLASVIVPPTMQVSWVGMINALTTGDYSEANNILRSVREVPIDQCIAELSEKHAEFSINVSLAAEPIKRHSMTLAKNAIFAVSPIVPGKSEVGDIYTRSITSISKKPSRQFTESQPSEVIASVVIKSAIWQKIKNENVSSVAAVIYGDEDASIDFLRDINKTQFWAATVRECTKHKLRGQLSEIINKAFFKLGVRGIHLNMTSNVDTIVHSIMSYFGASLRDIAIIVADEVCKIAGRRAEDFRKPVVEKTITNAPSGANSSLRKQHMRKMVAYNVTNLKKRLTAIDSRSITHTGDMRVCKDPDGRERRAETKARRVFLQVRKAVYKSVKVLENAEVEIEAEELKTRIMKAAFTAITRKTECAAGIAESEESDRHERQQEAREEFTKETGLDYSIDNVWEAIKSDKEGITLEDIKDYMEQVDPVVTCVGGYWNAEHGFAGMRYSVQQLCEDSEMTKQTKFAVSPSEIAPLVYRNVMTSRVTTTDIYDTEVPDVEMTFGDVSDDDLFDPFNEEEMENFMSGKYNTTPKLEIPLWQALATLLYCGNYDVSVVNQRLGINVPMYPRGKELRALNLYNLRDDDIKSAFPEIEAEYFMCGTAYSRDWYEEDDDGGYMVDETTSIWGGSLF